MKIDFKKPKYVLPIILLPFFFLLFYGYKSFSKETSGEETILGTADIQSKIGEVSEQIKDRPLTSKFDASKDSYKRSGDGYTAINSLRLDVEDAPLIEGQYNDREKRMLDSIDNALRESMNKMPDPKSSYSPYQSRQAQISKEDEELLQAIENLQGTPARSSESQNKYEDPMDLFKAQMVLIDSISKANDPEYQKSLQQKEKEIPSNSTPDQSDILRVQKAFHSSAHFNTVTQNSETSFIKAIVDEDIKNGTLGARLRIRLLDDIMIGNALIKEGTYLYALITGYESQRVKLTISSVMVGDNIYPIELSIYDVDGIEGLYVPASAFREFSKELGSSTTGGMNLQMDNAESMNQLYMSAIQKMFSSTSKAVSKTIRQNKANVKYGSFLYLIDPEQLSNNEKMINPKN